MKITQEQATILTLMSQFGDCVELNYKFDSDNVIRCLSQLKYQPGSGNKLGVNLTGPVDDLGLDSKDKHAQDQSYNSNLQACPELVKFFDLWTDLARCRAVIMNEGSFFKMHRDAFRDNPQFRIFIPLNNTEDHEWRFMYESGELKFKPGVPYILNTRKSHGSFCMADNTHHVLMSVHINQDNFRTITQLLPNCKDH